MTPEFKKRWFRKKAHEIPADAELVSCMPLSLVLEMFGISQIDFFSLDVEVILSKRHVLYLCHHLTRFHKIIYSCTAWHCCCICQGLHRNRKSDILCDLGSWVIHRCSRCDHRNAGSH